MHKQVNNNKGEMLKRLNERIDLYRSIKKKAILNNHDRVALRCYDEIKKLKVKIHRLEKLK